MLIIKIFICRTPAVRASTFCSNMSLQRMLEPRQQIGI